MTQRLLFGGSDQADGQTRFSFVSVRASSREAVLIPGAGPATRKARAARPTLALPAPVEVASAKVARKPKTLEERIEASESAVEMMRDELRSQEDACIHGPGCTPDREKKIQALRRKIEWEERRLARIDRYQDRAEKAYAEREAYFNSPANRTLHGMQGEPVKVGHHSERRHRALIQRAWRDMDKGCEAGSKAKHYERRAEAAARNTAVSSCDPSAVEKLQTKLAGLIRYQETMRDANKVIRKFKVRDDQVAELRHLGLSDSNVDGLLTPDYMNRVGFPAYALQNNNAEIKRVKDRIAKLEAAAGTEDREWIGNGCTVRLTAERGPAELQVCHDSKPDDATRKALKAHGFHWVRSLGFWSAQDTAYRRQFAVGLTAESAPEDSSPGA